MGKAINWLILIWLVVLTSAIFYLAHAYGMPAAQKGWQQPMSALYNADTATSVGIGTSMPRTKLEVAGGLLSTTYFKDGTSSRLSNGYDLTGLGITGGQFTKTYPGGGFGGLVFGTNAPGEINNRILGCFLADFNQHCAGMECTYTPESNNFITQLTASNGADTATEIFLTDYTGVRFKMGFRSRVNDVYIQSPSQSGAALIVIPDSGHAGIKIRDGSQASGYVLTSDSTGVGAWRLHDLSGSSVFSGGGTSRTFRVRHELGIVPSRVLITPTSADGAESFYISAKTKSDFSITYLKAPAAGKDNISFDWLLKP